MYRNKYLGLLFLFLLLLLLVLNRVLESQKVHELSYLEQMEESITRLFNVSIENKYKVTETIFNDYITEDIKSLIYRGNTKETEERNHVRNELAASLTESFRALKGIGIEYIEFYAIDGSLIASFHDGNESEIIDGHNYETVKKTLRRGYPNYGFEESAILNGYRYVYPIYYKNALVGATVFSHSLKNIISPIEQTYGVSTLLIMDKAIVEADHNSKLEINRNYLEEGYWIDGYIDRAFFNEPFIEKLELRDDTLEKIEKKVLAVIDGQQVPPAVFYEVNNNDYILVIPIRITDVNGRPLGTLLFFNNDRTLFGFFKQRRGSMNTILILSFCLFLLVAVAVILMYRLQMQANRDVLTKLYNRNFCTRHLENQEEPGIVLMIDVDDFKRVNDKYGHLVGDYILEELGKLFINNIRKEDFAVRWGGEEFLIYLKNTTLEEGDTKAKQILELVREHDFKYCDITVSIGVAFMNGRMNASITAADDCLLEAKRRGKNTTVMETEPNI